MKTKFSIIAKTVILLTFLSGAAFGQSQVTYKNIWDNPYSWKSLIVNLHWFDATLPGAINVGVGADYQLNRRVNLNIDYSKNVMGSMLNDKGLKRNSGYLETGGVFCFANWMRKGKAAFGWADAGMKYTVTVPSKVLKQYGVRGGLLSYTEILRKGDVYASTNGFYGGISILTTRYRSISISGVSSSKTKAETRKNFYVDVLLASVSYTPNADYNSLAFQIEQPYKKFGTEKDFSRYENTNWDSVLGKNLLGYRMGVMWTMDSFMGTYWKKGIEFGARPGPTNNFYLVGRFAFSLGFEVPSLSNMEEKKKSGFEGE